MKLNFMTKMVAIATIVSFNIGCGTSTQTNEEQTIVDFLNLRSGMFIHFNMGTFHGEQWAKPNHDPKSFNPTKLDCEQWAKAAKSAKMSYGVLTTKHHDGFCLWDSAATDYDVASSSYDGDVVKEYVDAFRKEGLAVGLYYSMWDRTHSVETGNITDENMSFIKCQIKELLTNYGDVVCFVIDGWGSVWGKGPNFEELPFDVIADYIHSIQPNCLVINHSCETDRSRTQVVHYEATHGQHCSFDNTIPSQQGPTIQPTWFWESGYDSVPLLSVNNILSEMDFCNSHYANYLLNAAPSSDGLMDENVIQRLAEVGDAWTPPAPISNLPKETKPNACVTAIANERVGYEAVNVLDANLYTVWQAPEGEESPTIILDFGSPKTFNLVLCGEAHKCKDVEEFEISAFVDNKWQKLVTGTTMFYHFESSFEDVTAQKYRLRITKYKKIPQIAELTFVYYNDKSVN